MRGRSEACNQSEARNYPTSDRDRWILQMCQLTRGGRARTPALRGKGGRQPNSDYSLNQFLCQKSLQEETYLIIEA